MALLPDKDYVVTLQVNGNNAIRLLRGNIAEHPADAIVNAANSYLLAGAGVCGAIHRAGGPVIADECRHIAEERGPIPPGQAVSTNAGLLPAKYVIHTVGPIWTGGNSGEAEIMANCYLNSMRLADELGLHSIAFPAISTGVFGYPMDNAANLAIPILMESLHSAKRLVLVSIVLFDKSALDTFAKVAFSIQETSQNKNVSIGVIDA